MYLVLCALFVIFVPGQLSGCGEGLDTGTGIDTFLYCDPSRQVPLFAQVQASRAHSYPLTRVKTGKGSS